MTIEEMTQKIPNEDPLKPYVLLAELYKEAQELREAVLESE